MISHQVIFFTILALAVAIPQYYGYSSGYGGYMGSGYPGYYGGYSGYNPVSYGYGTYSASPYYGYGYY